MTAAMIAVLVLATGLSACGRRGKLVAPEGEESAYTYPRFYPASETVVPSEPAPALPDEEETAKPEVDPPELTPFPASPTRTTTKTYGTSAQ